MMSLAGSQPSACHHRFLRQRRSHTLFWRASVPNLNILAHPGGKPKSYFSSLTTSPTFTAWSGGLRKTQRYNTQVRLQEKPATQGQAVRITDSLHLAAPSGSSFSIWTKVTLSVVGRWPMRLSKVVVLGSGHFCQCGTSLKDSLGVEAPPGLAETSWGLQCHLRASRAPSCLSHFLYRYYSSKNLLYSLSTVMFQGAQPATVLWIRGQQIMVHGPILACGLLL